MDFFKALRAGLVLILCGISAHPQSLTLKGQLQLTPDYESAYYVTVQNQKAFVSTERNLKIIDVSNPKNPTLLVQAQLVAPNPGVLWLGKPLVQGNFAFVLANFGRLFQIDFTDITNLHVTSVSFQMSEPLPIGHGMSLVDNRLYVPIGNGVEILEVFGAGGPVSLGRATSDAGIYEVKVADGLAYVAAGNGLRIIDVTNPQSPWLVGSLATGITSKISLVGSTAYLLSYTNELATFQVVNVSNPVNPTVTYAAPYTRADPSLYALAINASTAFVAYTPGLFTVIYNLSNPTQPSPIGEVNIVAADLEVSGNYCYVAHRHSGLVIYNIQNPSQPAREGTFQTGAEAEGIVEGNGYAYLRDPYNGTRIIDARDPSQPKHVATYVSPDGARSLLYVGPTFLNGNKAYISTWRGFDIVDVSNPATPTRFGSYRGSGALTPTVVVSGNYAYTSALQIIDVSNPADPHLVGSFSLPVQPLLMSLQGNFIYYLLIYSVPIGQDLDWRSEVGVIDITDPLAPRKRGTITTPGSSLAYAKKITPAYPAVFMDTGYGSINVIDVRNPDQIYIASSKNNFSFDRFDVSGSNLFLTGGKTMLLTDVSDPWSPVDGPQISALPIPYQTRVLTADGNLAFVAWSNMLQIYEGILAPPPLRPELKVVKQGGNLIFRWPKAFADYQLYSMPAIGQPHQLVTSNPPSDGDNFSFTNTRPIGTSQFYLLAK